MLFRSLEMADTPMIDKGGYAMLDNCRPPLALSGMSGAFAVRELLGLIFDIQSGNFESRFRGFIS